MNRKKAYFSLDLGDLVQLMNEYPSHRAAIRREQRRVVPQNAAYLNNGNCTLPTRKLWNEFHHSPLENAFLERGFPKTFYERTNPIMERFLHHLGIDDQSICFAESSTRLMEDIVRSYRIQNSQGAVIVPSESYRASYKALASTDHHFRRLELRVGNETRSVVDWETISRNAQGELILDDDVELLIMQAGSNLHGTQATLSGENGIFDNIHRVNEERKRKGVPTLAVIVDDCASRPGMIWKNERSEYRQIQVRELDFPACLVFSTHKAYGLWGSVGVINTGFKKRATSLLEKWTRDAPQWGRFIRPGFHITHYASLDHLSTVLDECTVQGIAAHNLQMVYRIVDQLAPLIQKRSIKLISPDLREAEYSPAEQELIEGIVEPRMRAMVQRSPLDPQRIDFHTVTFQIPKMNLKRFAASIKRIQQQGVVPGSTTTYWDGIPYLWNGYDYGYRGFGLQELYPQTRFRGPAIRLSTSLYTTESIIRRAVGVIAAELRTT